MSQKQILLTALLQIKANGPLDPEDGICTNVELVTMNVEGTDDLAIAHIMGDIFFAWPKFSKDPLYPVPFKDYDPAGAFHATLPGHSLWEGEYGDNRKELLDFLIAELQKDSE